MRRGLVLVLLVSLTAASLLPSIVAAQANQAEPATEVVVSDPAGDVGLTVAPRTAPQHANASQVAGGQVDHLDLLRVSMGQETEKTFQVSLTLKVGEAPQSARPMRYVTFSYGRVDWQLLLGGCPVFGQGQAQAPEGSACLRFRDAGSGFRAVSQVPGTRDGSTFTWTLQKDLIFNENRVPGRYGAALTNLSATAMQYFAGGGGFGFLDPTGGAFAIDRAPQEGVAKVPLVFQRGAGGRGHLLLTAPDPIRVTNGEATTIVYKLDLLNRHAERRTVLLTTSGGESDWSIRVPPRLLVDGGATVSVPVILSLPFRHLHGQTALFTVQAEDAEDAGARASTQLGVFWTDVPQPSGHHECDNSDVCGQWFHSAPIDNPAPDQFDLAFPFKAAWFNGVAKDPAPNADDANVPAFFNDHFFCLFRLPNCPVPPQWSSSWFFPMSPSLLMGLDFDISREGLARLTFLPSLLDPGARVEAQLVYCDPTKQGSGGGSFTFVAATCYQYTTLLGSGTISTSLSPGQQVTVEVPLKMETAADLVPYQRGANIGLSVRVLSTLPQNTILVPPRIEFVTQRSHLHMPLLEYHDPVDQQFADLGAIKIQPLDPHEKPVNPGRATVFRFDVTNEHERAQRLELSVEGINKEWARVVAEGAGSPPSIVLGPKQRANFSLLVTAPFDAVADERAELFVVVQSVDEPLLVALSRVRATVVTGLDVPDESGLVRLSAGNESPGFGALAVLVSVIVLLSRRRPSRQ